MYGVYRIQSIKEFRNSSWYQSQFSETLIPSGHLLFRPSFIPAKSLWPSLNPTIFLSGHLSFRSSLSLVISHFGHQSLFSESREKTLSGRSNRRQKTFTAGNFSGELFRRTFRRRFFSTPQGAPGGDIQFVPKHRNQKPIHAPSTRVFPASDCISRAGV